MTSLPPRTCLATSRRITRSPFLSSPPPMTIRQPRRRRSSDIRALFGFLLVEPGFRAIHLAGDSSDHEGRAVVRPAHPPVLGDADAATVAAKMRKLLDRLRDRRLGAGIFDPRHHLRRQCQAGDALAVARESDAANMVVGIIAAARHRAVADPALVGAGEAAGRGSGGDIAARVQSDRADGILTL